jgi:hypothetical protein
LESGAAATLKLLAAFTSQKVTDFDTSQQHNNAVITGNVKAGNNTLEGISGQIFTIYPILPYVLRNLERLMSIPAWIASE